jgi:hypothetical protein
MRSDAAFSGITTRQRFLKAARCGARTGKARRADAGDAKRTLSYMEV